MIFGKSISKRKLRNLKLALMKLSMFKLTTWKQFWMMTQQKSLLLFLVTQQKKLLKRSKSGNCKLALTSQQADLDNDSYLKTLSRGGLFTPSRCLADFVCNSFAILEYLEHDIIAFEIPVAKAATYTLKRYGSVSNFTCETHRDWGFEFGTKIIVNIFFNNKQK